MKRDQIVRDPRLSGVVDRYHTWPTLNRQTTGEHSWQVMRIYHQMFGVLPSVVAVHILYHDSPELANGDPPFPVKSRNPDLKAIYNRLDVQAIEEMGIVVELPSPQELAKIKICDLVEMWEFGTHEFVMGNTLAEPIITDTLGAAHDMAVDCLSEEDFELYDIYIRRRRQMYG